MKCFILTKRLFYILSLFVLVFSVAPFRTVLALSEAEWNSVRNNGPFYLPPSCSVTSGSGTSELDGFKLPASHGYTGLEEKINTSGQVPSTGGRVTFANHADNNKHSDGGKAFREYYITMRWTYAKWYWNGGADVVDNKQIGWLHKKPRLVLVTNPRTKKSIIAAVLEAGPAPWTGIDTGSNNNAKFGWKQPQLGTPPDSSGYKGRVSGFPPTAMKALGAKMGQKNGKIGDDLTYQWAPDQNAKPGPTTLSGSNSSSSQASSACGGGAFVNADGYAFPIGLQKDDVSNGYNWPCPSVCHHDKTPAFDLAHKKTVSGNDDKATTGRQVFAIFDGNMGYIDNAYGGVSGCVSFNFKGKDGWDYWYGHLAKIKVQKGQKVKAGDVLAEVGARKCTGNGSYPHLHIDRGSPKGRPGGSDCCRDKGFVSLLNAIYEDYRNGGGGGGAGSVGGGNSGPNSGQGPDSPSQ